jgi:hypothetical protein
VEDPAVAAKRQEREQQLVYAGAGIGGFGLMIFWCLSLVEKNGRRAALMERRRNLFSGE